MNGVKKRPLSLKVFGQGVIELLFYLPVLLTAAVYLLPASAIWVWIGTLPLCYWVASLMIGKWSKLRYGVRLLLASTIGAVHAFLFIGSGAGELQIASIALCGFVAAIIAVRGMAAYLRGWVVSFPNSQLLVGIMSYVASQPLKLLLFKKLIDYNGVLIICGIASVIIFFFFINERHLNSETVDRGKTPAFLAFKRQNRMILLIIVSIISIIALFQQIQQVIERYFYSILEWLMRWLNRPVKQEPTEEPSVNEQPPGMLPADEVKPPSEWLLLLEQMLKIIGIVLVIFFVIIILFIVFKKLYQWAKVIMAKLQERGADNRRGEAAFTDEFENLMTLTNLRNQMGKQLKKLLPKNRSQGKGWNELTSNAEKIRFLYAHILQADAKQGYTVQAHLTPRETGEDLAKWKDGKLKREGIECFIDVYERVRYGDKLPDNQQVAAFKEKFDKGKNNS